MYCNFVNTLFSRHERRSSMTGLAIGSIKARDEIPEVVVVVVVYFFFLVFFLLLPLLVLVLLLLVKTKPLGRGSWTHLSLLDMSGLNPSRESSEESVHAIPLGNCANRVSDTMLINIPHPLTFLLLQSDTIIRIHNVSSNETSIYLIVSSTT